MLQAGINARSCLPPRPGSGAGHQGCRRSRRYGTIFGNQTTLEWLNFFTVALEPHRDVNNISGHAFRLPTDANRVPAFEAAAGDSAGKPQAAVRTGG